MKRSKADWRRELLATRAAIPEAERRRRSLAMLAHVRTLPWIASARSLLAYVPIGAEADVVPLMSEVLGDGRPVFVPADKVSVDAIAWMPWEEGHPSPARVVAADLQYPVVALVPGVGFDERCVRLGRGRGFYDRALVELRRNDETRAVGIAFEPQIVQELPHDAWDQSVDIVVSESRVLAASGTPAKRESSACS